MAVQAFKGEFSLIKPGPEVKVREISSNNVQKGRFPFGLWTYSFPVVCFAGAGNRTRGQESVNAWANGQHIGAPWNRKQI